MAKKATGLTQKQLGEMCGYTGQGAMVTVNRWESDTRPVPIEKIRILAKSLHMSLDELIP
ncbi:MAG: helix-turn-helix transcriptional regulator [Clostridia bacterium]|nr:helix-turn-helix transcriptional regulator [Clostridia bacterium]